MDNLMPASSGLRSLPPYQPPPTPSRYNYPTYNSPWLVRVRFTRDGNRIAGNKKVNPKSKKEVNRSWIISKLQICQLSKRMILRIEMLLIQLAALPWILALAFDKEIDLIKITHNFVFQICTKCSVGPLNLFFIYQKISCIVIFHIIQIQKYLVQMVPFASLS